MPHLLVSYRTCRTLESVELSGHRSITQNAKWLCCPMELANIHICWIWYQELRPWTRLAHWLTYCAEGIIDSLETFCYPERRLPYERCIFLHSDNTAVHNLECVKERMNIRSFTWMEYPCYDQPLALLDFFLSFLSASSTKSLTRLGLTMRTRFLLPFWQLE
jgi:hypothetical protein